MQPPFCGLEAILEVGSSGAGPSPLPSPRISPNSSGTSSPLLCRKNTLPLSRDYSHRLRTGSGRSLTPPRRTNSLTRAKEKKTKKNSPNPRSDKDDDGDAGGPPRRVNSLTLTRESSLKLRAQSFLAARRVNSLTLSRGRDDSQKKKLNGESASATTARRANNNASSSSASSSCVSKARDNNNSSLSPRSRNSLSPEPNNAAAASLAGDASLTRAGRERGGQCPGDGGRSNSAESPRSPHLRARHTALLDVRKFFKLGSRLTPGTGSPPPSSPRGSPRGSPRPSHKYAGGAESSPKPEAKRSSAGESAGAGVLSCISLPLFCRGVAVLKVKLRVVKAQADMWHA